MKAKQILIKLVIIPLVLVNIFHVSAGVSKHLGNFMSYQKVDHGVVIIAENAKLSLTVYSPEIIRIQAVAGDFDPQGSYGVIQQHQGNFSEIKEEAGQLLLSTSVLNVTVTKSPVRIHFYNKGGELLNEDDANLGIAWQGTEVTSYKRLLPGERFIGLGEKTGSLDRRGRSFVNWNTDHYAYGIEDDPLYVSIPFFIGVHDRRVYGIFLDNTHRTTFDFGASSDNQFSSFSAVDGEMNYYFFGGSSVAAIIEEYSYLTGRMRMPPLWSLGYQQCRWSYYPDTEVLDLARAFRQKHIPADVIYLDIHYMDAYKIFTWHPDRFPQPKHMIDSLKEMGFHVVTIVDPGIKIESGYFAYDEGVKNDYFIKYPNGDPYIGSVWPGRCHFPDFTKPRVREWWGKSFSHLTQAGVEGFWNDMNEPAVWGQSIPDLVQFGAGENTMTMKEAHNIYGMQMARSTFEGTKSLMNGQRPFVLTRAGYSGIQRYSAVWTGDNVPSDEHMLLAVRMVNSMGLSGIAFAGSDIGGFSGDATPELFSRWLSIGTYTPFFRNHKQYGMKRQEPWSFGEEIEATSRKSIEQRYRLLPYLYSSFYQASQTGLPVERSLAIDYTHDEHIYWNQYQHEYLFGDNILVAPVSSKEQYAQVYFPTGQWYRISSDQLYEGNQSAVVEAPLHDLPVFVKAGGIIPMQSVVQYTAQKPSDTLHLHVYFGESKTSFTYYEDDGITYEYENGAYYKRTISFSPKTKEVIMDKPEGSFATKFFNINLILHGFGSLRTISVNNKTIQLQGGGGTTINENVVFQNTNGRIVIQW